MVILTIGTVFFLHMVMPNDRIHAPRFLRSREMTGYAEFAEDSPPAECGPAPATAGQAEGNSTPRPPGTCHTDRETENERPIRHHTDRAW